MRRLFPQKKDSIPSLLKHFLDHLRLVGGLIPPRTLCGKSTPRGRTLCWRLLLLFGGLGFRILESSPFPPPVILLHGDAHSLGWNWQRWGPASARIIPLYLPSRAPGKVRPQASFPIPDFPNPQGGGPNTESSSPLLASPGQRATLRNNFMMNKRQCVRLEDFLLVRRRGYCSGPRPR